MSRMIELHDSQLGEKTTTGDRTVVGLTPASILQSAGRPGRDDRVSYYQDVELDLSGLSILGDWPESPGWIVDGSLDVDGTLYDNVIPLPFDAMGPVRLDLGFNTGERLILTARAMAIRLVGEVPDPSEWEDLDAS